MSVSRRGLYEVLITEALALGLRELTWRLHHPLPGDLFASFAAAVA
jgi:hypothetical protein